MRQGFAEGHRACDCGPELATRISRPPRTTQTRRMHPPGWVHENIMPSDAEVPAVRCRSCLLMISDGRLPACCLLAIAPIARGRGRLFGCKPDGRRSNFPCPLRQRTDDDCAGARRHVVVHRTDRATGSAAWRRTERPSRNSNSRIPGARRESSRSAPTTISGSPNIWGIASAGSLRAVRSPSFRSRRPEPAARDRARPGRQPLVRRVHGRADRPHYAAGCHHRVCHSDAKQRAARDCRGSGRQSVVLRIQRRQDRADDAERARSPSSCCRARTAVPATSPRAPTGTCGFCC